MGDPAGCGPAMTAAAWAALRAGPGPVFYLIGAPGLIRGVPVRPIASPSEAAGVFAGALPVLALEAVPPVTPGRPDAAAAPAIIASIERAVADALAGRASGVVTNPVNKALLYASGFGFPGHTEFVAHLCERAGHPVNPVMLLTGGGLRVALATIHMPLAEVAGREEIDIINPAADHLQAEGIDICHARPGDTVFAEALGGAFDAVIAMTHDQGLIPVKTLDMWGGVNTTLGLPILRTSPDHGTAYDAAGAGTCRPDSLIAALRAAARLAEGRRSAAA